MQRAFSSGLCGGEGVVLRVFDSLYHSCIYVQVLRCTMALWKAYQPCPKIHEGHSPLPTSVPGNELLNHIYYQAKRTHL